MQLPAAPSSGHTDVGPLWLMWCEKHFRPGVFLVHISGFHLCLFEQNSPRYCSVAGGFFIISHPVQKHIHVKSTDSEYCPFCTKISVSSSCIIQARRTAVNYTCEAECIMTTWWFLMQHCLRFKVNKHPVAVMITGNRDVNKRHFTKMEINYYGK